MFSSELWVGSRIAFQISQERVSVPAGIGHCKALRRLCTFSPCPVYSWWDKAFCRIASAPLRPPLGLWWRCSVKVVADRICIASAERKHPDKIIVCILSYWAFTYWKIDSMDVMRKTKLFHYLHWVFHSYTFRSIPLYCVRDRNGHG